MKKVNTVYIVIIAAVLLVPAVLLYAALGLGRPQADTMKYIKAVTAVLNDVDFNPDVFGGLLKPENTQDMKNVLKNTDEITSREELLESIDYYKAGTYTQYFNFYYDSYKQQTEEWVNYIEQLKLEEPEILNNYAKVFDEFKRQNCTIRAYELTWEMSYAAWGYVADYLTFEEAADICVEAARELQEKFGSWEEYRNNYILGQDFLYCENPEYYDSEHQYLVTRFETVENLASKPYSIDFYTELNLEEMKESQVSAKMRENKRFIIAAIFALLIETAGFLIIPKFIFNKKLNKADEELKSEKFSAKYVFDRKNSRLWIDVENGQIAVLEKWNALKVQKISADKIENIKIADGMTAGYETKSVKVIFDIDGVREDIPTFISNVIVSMEKEEVKEALKKAEIYKQALINAKENSKHLISV